MNTVKQKNQRSLTKQCLNLALINNIICYQKITCSQNSDPIHTGRTKYLTGQYSKNKLIYKKKSLSNMTQISLKSTILLTKLWITRSALSRNRRSRTRTIIFPIRTHYRSTYRMNFRFRRY